MVVAAKNEREKERRVESAFASLSLSPVSPPSSPTLRIQSDQTHSPSKNLLLLSLPRLQNINVSLSKRVMNLQQNRPQLPLLPLLFLLVAQPDRERVDPFGAEEGRHGDEVDAS